MEKLKNLIKNYCKLLLLTGLIAGIAGVINIGIKSPYKNAVYASTHCSGCNFSYEALHLEKEDIEVLSRATPSTQTNETGESTPLEEVKEESFETGLASAYGGWSDAAIRDNQITATGETVTEYSTGVAVPISKRHLIGRNVKIRYNGEEILCRINDCGSMDNGNRDLDLQPGVFKYFGFESCDGWGLRYVEYIIE